MTDILMRLAALTAIDKYGLLPCAICGHPNEVDGIRPTLESNRRRVVCTHCGITTIWCDSAEQAIRSANDRPREAALIALVQEAAGEIERWRKEYRLMHEQYSSVTEKLRQVSKRVEELDPPAPGWGGE